MKKFLLTVLALALACCCVLFAGCSKQQVYKFTKLTVEDDDTEYSFEVGDKFEGIRLTEDYATLILDGDTAILRMCYTKTVDDDTKEYKSVMKFNIVEGVDDEIYAFSEDDDEGLIAVKNKKTITVEYSGMILVFTK